MKRNGISYRVTVLFCSNAVLSVMGFAYRIALSRFAGAYALGLNSLVMQIYGVIVSVCISGMNTAVSALAARLEDDMTHALLKTALLLSLMLWALAALPLALFGRTLEAAFFREEGIFKTLLLMLICIFMTGIENILRSVHLGKGRASPCAASELLEQGIRFALVIALLRHIKSSDPDKVFLIMLGMTASEIVSVSFLSTSYIINFGRFKSKKKAGLLFRETASIAFPASLTAVSSSAFASFGSLMLPDLLAKYGLAREEALSVMGILNTVCIPVTMLPMAFAGAVSAVIMPEISGMAERGVSPEKLIRRAFISVGVSGAVSSFLIFMFSDSITRVVFGLTADRTVFMLLSVKAVVIFIQVVSTSALNGMMRQKKVFLFAAASEAYQLVLIILLTPVLGVRGCCLGMAAGEIMRLLLNTAEIRSILKSGGFCGGDMLKSNRTNVS